MTTQFVHFNDSSLAREASGLLSVLEHLHPVMFQVGDRGGDAPIGRICSNVVACSGDGLPAAVPTLGVPPATRGSGDERLVCTNVRFADDPEVPWPYRGRSIAVRAELDATVHGTLAGAGDQILATDTHGKPIWTRADHRSERVFRTSLCLPHAPLGEDVGLAAGEERFIQVLPLFHFLRQVTAPHDFSHPPLRAAFVIDDPNLHWPSYGHVDYRAIARSARHDHYHVAFATVPLDAWWVHGKTADIFRDHPDGLSLLIHGNNHAKQELAQSYSSEAADALLQQAMARIQQLEVKAGLAVSRVMVPPHGACSSRMLAALPHHGFESACMSAGSLRAHNAGQAWTRMLGLAPSELVEGCPVLPRWAFGSANNATLLAAAYLGQPLILRGHHQDLKEGLDLFRGFASTINALGDVRWGSLGELSRLNYRHRIEGSTMHIHPLATRIDVDVPHGIADLRIESQWLDWQALQPKTTLECISGCRAVAAVVGGRRYGFARHIPAASVVTPKATSAKLIMRRILTEARDRMRFT